MRALVVHQPGGPEAMRLQQLPAPQPGPHQVVVAVEAVGVNPVDAGNRADPSWAGVNPPYVVGYELAGRIQAAGDDADWRPGELVWGLLPVRGTRWGTYAELVTLDAALVAPRPPQPQRGPGRLAPAGRRHLGPAAGPAGAQAGRVGAGPRRGRWGRQRVRAAGPGAGRAGGRLGQGAV